MGIARPEENQCVSNTLIFYISSTKVVTEMCAKIHIL
jgi:hypothetical protein